MYDLSVIKSVRCENIAKKFGMQLQEKGNKLWGKLRDEKTASFSISKDKNLWYDFGLGKGGSNIDLVMELAGISKEKAIKWIADEFGIEGEKENPNKWRALTDDQYRKIGIKPEKATMNFNIDLNIQPISLVERWYSQYGISVSELGQKFPKIHDRMIIKIGLKNIEQLRDTYYQSLGRLMDKNINEITRDYIKYSTKDIAQEVNEMVKLLQKAVVNKNVDFSSYKLHYEKTIEAIEKQNEQAEKPLSKDEIVKNKMVNVYKKLFKCDLGYLSIEQAKALKDINLSISQKENQYLSIEMIKKVYKVLGGKTDDLQKEYENILNKGKNILKNSPEYKEWKSKAAEINESLLKVKDLFNKSSLIIEGIREEKLKEISENKRQSPNIELKKSLNNEMSL